MGFGGGLRGVLLGWVVSDFAFFLPVFLGWGADVWGRLCAAGECDRGYGCAGYGGSVCELRILTPMSRNSLDVHIVWLVMLRIEGNKLAEII